MQIIYHSCKIIFLGAVLSLIATTAQAADSEPPRKTMTKADHRQFAKLTNGEAWKLLQKNTLNEDERDQLIYAVFASAYHWHKAGGIVHRQRAEWLISRAYTKINNGPSALLHARNCLKLTEIKNAELEDFDFAYAFEGMARAYAVNNDFKNAAIYYNKANIAAQNIRKQEDRQLFLKDLADGNWNGFSSGN